MAKRTRVIATVDEMKAKGEPITPTTVMRAANVSNWLVYQPDLKAYIAQAARSQAASLPGPRGGGSRASSASVAVDLELARQEISRLRAEREKLLDTVRRNLGQQLGQRPASDLADRVNELEGRLAETTAECDQLRAALEDAHEALAVKDAMMKKLMRQRNSGQ